MAARTISPRRNLRNFASPEESFQVEFLVNRFIGHYELQLKELSEKERIGQNVDKVCNVLQHHFLRLGDNRISYVSWHDNVKTFLAILPRHPIPCEKLPIYVFQARVQVLQDFVRDLRDQNAVLVQTVDELEKEANERVTLVEDKLLKTRSLAKVVGYEKFFR